MTIVNVLSNSRKVFILCWTKKLKIFLALKAIILIKPDYEFLLKLKEKNSISLMGRNAAYKLLQKYHLEKLDYPILLECIESPDSHVRGVALIKLEDIPINDFNLEVLEFYQNHENEYVRNTVMYLKLKINNSTSPTV